MKLNMIKVDQGMEFQIETTYTQLISEHHSMGVEPKKTGGGLTQT